MLKVLGGEQEGEFKAVASGTLPNGKPVVVNADGTVSVVSVGTSSAGTAVQFESTPAYHMSSTYDANAQKIIIAYKDNSNFGYGTAVVGTVSGSSISFGTPVVLESNNSDYFAATYDANSQKIVVAYRDLNNSFYGYAKVGTVSGTSISFGSKATFESAVVWHISATYDANAQKVIIAYTDNGNSDYGTAIVGTVSGTSISFGSATVYEAASSYDNTITYDASSQKVVVAYYDTGNSSYGTAAVGTVSGTSISFGTPVVFETGATQYPDIVYDSSNSTVVVAYMDGGDGDKGKAVIGTVSGTSISFTSPTVFYDTATVSSISASYDSNAGSVAISFRGAGAYGMVVDGATTASSITFGSPLTITTNAYSSVYSTSTYDPVSQKVVISYSDQDDSDSGKSVVYTSPSSNLTAENYIGMSRGVVDSVAEETGTATVFEASNIASSSAAFDSNSDKIVIAYKDQGNSNYGTAVVGTVSGTSISFGTPVVFETATVFMQPQAVTYDSVNNKVVISYTDNGNSNYGTAVVGTVSGTSISFGTPVVFETASAGKVQSIFDSANSKVVVCYDDGGNADYITAVVGTVSGTSISFGTPVVAHAAAVDWNSITYDSNEQKVVIAYRNRDNSDYGTAVVGTVSGASISFGTPVVFESNFVEYTAPAFDTTNNKVVIAYRNNGSSNHGTAIVGTVSGTSISFGTAVVFNESTTNNNSAVFDSNSNKIIISYRDEGNSSYGTFITGSVSGDTINFDTPTVFEAASTSQISSTFDSVSNKVIISYEDIGNSNYGTGIVVQPSYVTRGSVADTNPASMDIIGSVSTNQLSLTAGEKYYVQTDGTLSTTAGSPSVLAGTAISSTELLVKT